MRIAPIRTPNRLIIKIAYFFSKRMFGKVLSPLLVIYSRSTPIFSVAMKIVSTDKKLSLDQKIIFLIRNFVSHSNDCKFCANAIEFTSQKENYEFQKIKELLNFRASSIYTEMEKAVLEYVEQITLTKTVSDETFENLKNYFSEKEIVEITWVCASENYFNMQAKPLGFTSDGLVWRQK